MRSLLTIVAAGAMVLALSACQPEPGDSPAPASTSSPSSTATAAPEPVPTPSQTTLPIVDIELPAACEDAFSDRLRADFEASGMPLGDPGLTMLSTELVEGLEIMDVAPTLRCTWGVPSEVGIATNITLITPEQQERLILAYQARGLACAEESDQTLCQAQSEVADGEMSAAFGEVQVFRANAWITTRWINADVAGYTDDIVTSLWN